MKMPPYFLDIDIQDACHYGFDAWDEGQDRAEFLKTTFVGKPLPEDWVPPRHSVELPRKYRRTPSNRALALRSLRDFIFGYPQAPFVSERAYGLLKDFLGQHAEFRLIGSVLDVPYYVMNVLALIDCLDFERSDVHRWDKDPSVVCGIHKWVFRADVLRRFAGVPLFKLPQYPYVILANMVFVEFVRKHRLTGVGFVDPNAEGIFRPRWVFDDLPIRPSSRRSRPPP